MDTQFKPGDTVYLPYKSRGVICARISYTIVYNDGDVEYYLEGWSGAYHKDDLWMSFEAAERFTEKFTKKK